MFEWYAVHERRGLAALRGLYRAAAMFGGGAMELVIDDNGHGTFADETIEIVAAREDGTATMRVGGATSECFYRLTDERLTLRCAEHGESAPKGFGRNTIVLVRVPQ